jgi:hypothetical protein
MTTAWKVMALSVLALGQASAAGPTKVQDPPGNVDVDQPAGVSLPERNTERDWTDTLRGGGRTDVIDGERAGRRALAPDVRASETYGNVQPGSEARASFDAGTGSGAASAAPEGGEDTGSDSTALGTDLGYGTSTEPTAPSR